MNEPAPVETSAPVLAAYQLLNGGRARVAGSHLFRDQEADLIWMTDPYGCDVVAAQGISPRDCLEAVRLALDYATRPHPAEGPSYLRPKCRQVSSRRKRASVLSRQ